MSVMLKARVPLLIFSLLLSLMASTSAATCVIASTSGTCMVEEQFMYNAIDKLFESCRRERDGYGMKHALCYAELPTTVFIPIASDVSNHRRPLHPLMLYACDPYHLVPQRLYFSDLLNLTINTRIPTLLPGASLRVTNNSLSNFAINGLPITHPDLFHYRGVSAHGIAATLDHTLYWNIWIFVIPLVKAFFLLFPLLCLLFVGRVIYHLRVLLLWGWVIYHVLLLVGLVN